MRLFGFIREWILIYAPENHRNERQEIKSNTILLHVLSQKA